MGLAVAGISGGALLAGATVGAGALSAGASILGAQTGAAAQEKAAQTASDTQLAMFNQMQQRLQPFINQGTSANTMLNAQLPSLTAPINLTEDWLKGTPGYQFNLTQGLRSVQNSAASRGLGVSGAAQKGAAAYATGLADSTYQNQFSNALAQRGSIYGMLAGQQGLGENAAAGVGNAGITTGQGIAQNQIGAGNAAAAANVASGNAVGAGANSALTGYTLNNLFNGGGVNNNQGAGGYFSGSQGYLNPGNDALQDTAQDMGL